MLVSLLIYQHIGNLKGEGLLQGGVLIIKPSIPSSSECEAELKYVYQEQTGSELPMEAIMSVLNELHGGNN